MKKLTLFLISILFISLAVNAQEFNYIGVKKCTMCHKTEKQGSQLSIWEKSKHAEAYKTLQTEKADKIAAELGHTTKAVETPACLKCHATGYALQATRMEKGFDIADGVQCETCHGAGKDYSVMKVMKDKQASIDAGLIVWENDKAIEAQCRTCHNEESPTYKEFKFAESYKLIKHNIPKE